MEWTNTGGKAEQKKELSYLQIPYLITATIPSETEEYLKSLGLLDEAGGKGPKGPEFLAAEFYFPIFSPRGLFARTVSHLGQVQSTLSFVQRCIRMTHV